MIKLVNITKTYLNKGMNPVKALVNVNIEFENKGLYIIHGRSGSGKTSLLNVIGGLLSFDEGNISIFEKSFKEFRDSDWDKYRRAVIGYVFQDNNLIDDLNAYQNLEIPSLLAGLDHRKEFIKILNKLKLPNIEKREIYELSAGQKQRLSMARALIKDPQVILADEPTGNLDHKTASLIMQLMYEISKKKLVIMVTHDVEMARDYADYMIEIADGRIADIVFCKPKTDQTTIPHDSLFQEKYNQNITLDLKRGNLSFKYTLHLAFLFIKSGIKRFVLSVVLLFLSFVMLLTGITLYSYNLANNVSRYLTENNIREVILAKDVKYKNSFNEDVNKTIYKGKYIESRISSTDKISLYYKNKPISTNNLDTLEGEQLSFNSNYLFVENMPNPNRGIVPLSENEVLLSETLYKKLFGNDDYRFPVEVYTLLGKLIVTGTVEDYNNDSDNAGNEFNSYYNNFYNNNLYTYKQFISETFVANDPFDNEHITYITNLTNSIEGKSILANGEVAISETYAINHNLEIGDTIYYENLHDDIYGGRYLDSMNLYEMFPNGLLVVSIFNDVYGSIALSYDDYRNCLDIYNRYYFCDNVFVTPTNISEFTKSFYQIGYFKEPGVTIINQFYYYITEVNSILIPIYFFILLISLLSSFNGIEHIMNKRRKDIGVLRTLGVSKKEIARTFIFTSIMMSILSVLLGLLSFIFVIRYTNSIANNILLNGFKLIRPSITLILVCAFLMILVNIIIVWFQVRNRFKQQIFYNLYK